MTEQPKEYITTGDEIDEIEKRFNDLIEKGTIPWEEDCLNTLDNIRSHPVSIPPEGAAPAHSPDAHVPGGGIMTPTNYPVPSNGSLICTFADCHNCKDCIPLGKRGKNDRVCTEGYETIEGCCDQRRKLGKCPRGFQSWPKNP